MAERSLKFCRMTFRAVTYFANNLSGRNGVSQVWCFGQLLSNRPLICGSCAVLQIWRSKELLTSCVAERFFELVLQVWRFEWLLTGVIKPGIKFQVPRHDVSSSYSLGTNMDLPTLMLRRYRTSSSCLPNFKHRAYCDRPHLRQCSWVTSYLCLSICSFTHLPFGATIWPVAFHCNLKTEAPQFRMYCVSSTRSVEGEGIVRHA